MKFKFMNLEDPGIPVTFFLEGKKYIFEENKVYDRGQAVFNHINNCATPIMKYNKAKGQMEIISYKQRFTAIPVETSAAKTKK